MKPLLPAAPRAATRHTCISACALGLLGALALLAPSPAHAQLGVSDDRVSLPEGPGSLEGIGENVSVGGNMGQMSYQVPIDVPGGFAGLTPQLALSYSSGNGSSPVGIGWDLMVPSIERMTWKGLPAYGTDDLFAANGSDQLVEVGQQDGDRVYRARFEGGFIRYRWRNSGAGRAGHWIAEYPDGRVGYFGADRNGVDVPNARVSVDDGAGDKVYRYHLVEMSDLFGHHTRYRYQRLGAVSLIDRIEYVHTGGQARFAVQFSYEAREDLVSDAGAGFEVLLGQRLKSIDVLSENNRIRRYSLRYEPYADAGGLSRLAAVEQFGYLDEPYPIRFAFGYSEALGGICNSDECGRPFVVDMGTLPGGADIATGDVNLIDINGDALPDVLDTSQPGAHRFILNVLESEGRSRFDTSVVLSEIGSQSSHRLQSATVQVLDINGDGFSDLINSFTGEVLCNDASGDWSPSGIGPTGKPCLADGSQSLQLQEDEAGDPDPRHVRFIDIDNDKFIDVIRTPDSPPSTQIFRNTGGGFVAQESGVETLGWVFDGDNLQLADMNGDGLLDAVQIDTGGGIHYRLNLGRGAWAPIVDATGITLTPSEIPLAQIEDINGDALSDVVIVAGDELRYALNRNAGRFEDFITVTPSDIPGLPVRGSQTTVIIADMNGNGTQDVVWIGSDQARGHVRFLELFPVRPNLLSRIENGIGSVQIVNYGTSVAQQARDRDQGVAWKHRLPHGMNVVERVDTFATATGGENGAGVHEITEYRYRHGFYNSDEKRFHGFERTENRLLSDESQEPGLTISEYDVGVEDAYFNGLLLSQTVLSGLDESGSPLHTQRMAYDECEVAEVPAGGLDFPVRSICMIEDVSIMQEGAAASDWATTRTEYDYDGYGNATSVRNLGVVHRGPPEAPSACAPCNRAKDVFGAACGATCEGDEAFSDTEYITPGATTGGHWILGAAVRARQYGTVGGETSETTMYYDGQAFVGLPAGQLDKGLVTRVEARVRTGSDETIALARNRYDEHGNVVEMLDPNGSIANTTTHRRVREYDALGLNLRRTEILLEDEDGTPYRLRQEMGYEPLFNKVSESTATMRVVGGQVQSSRNSSFYRYDAFGRLHQLIRPGDRQDAPGLEASYELGDPVTAIVTRQRSQVGGEFDIESIRCLDGRGRTLQTRTRLGGGSYQVTGFTEYNQRGEPVRVFEPYLDSSSACATEPPGDEVRSTRIRYDALARNIETILPDGDIYGESSRQRMEYAPLATRQYDQEDNDPQSPQFNTPVVRRMDGLGRVVAVERHLDAAGTAPTTELHYDGLGRMVDYVDAAGNRKRQQYDLLGRVLSVDDPNAGTTSYEYDAAGNLTVHRDARGVTVHSRYDGANRPIERWDEADREGTSIRYRYDSAGVCSTQRCTNVEGKLAEVLYPVELGDGPTVGRDQFGFDTRGRAVYQARVLFGHEFATERSFDNADRLLRTLYPDGQALESSYDGAGRLVGIDGVIDRVVYDDRGQIEHVEYRNGTSTWTGYDDIMRLSELVTLDGDGQVVQGFSYVRDRVGNIESIGDMSAPSAGGIDASASFTYDPWYRVLNAKLGGSSDGEPESVDYQYDDLDNILSVTSSLDAVSASHVGSYVYDASRPNAVVQAGSQQRGYDAAGQLIQRGGQSLVWDYLGRLVGAEDGSGATVAHFAYGADQVRVAKREADTLTLYMAPEFEVRDGISVLYARMGRQRVARLQSDALATVLLSDLAPLGAGDGQINAADAWLAARAGETASSEGAFPHSAPDALLRSSARRLLMEADSGAVFLHADHLGSLTAATSEQGALSGRGSYDVSGEARRVTGFVDRYGFTGQERDQSTGLLHFQFRYLDTDTGRWLSPDPLFAQLSPAVATKLGESTVAYAYVANNPTNYVDPTGLEALVLGLYNDEATTAHKQYLQGQGTTASTYIDFRSAEGNDGKFYKSEFRKFAQAATEIHFNLNGLSLTEFQRYKSGDVRGSVQSDPDALNGGDITNFELDTILGDQTLRDKTTFHLGSKVDTDKDGKRSYKPGDTSLGKDLGKTKYFTNSARRKILRFFKARR